MTAPHFSLYKKMSPCDEYRKKPWVSKIRYESCRRYKKSRACIGLKEVITIKLFYTFFVLFILMCFFMTMIASELKVVRHTFEGGIDDWKVENSSWLRLPFSRLKIDHPMLAIPSQKNSTMMMVPDNKTKMAVMSKSLVV